MHELLCVFCHSANNTFNSVEHIVPESLGNSEHILPKGFVCDKCNNYFAAKVEKPVLETSYFKLIRHEQKIFSKKKRLPRVTAVFPHLQTGGEISIYPPSSKLPHWTLDLSAEIARSFHAVQRTRGSMIIQASQGQEVPKHLMSRFIAKIAFEALIAKMLKIYGSRHEDMYSSQLNDIRMFVREGSKPHIWPYHKRNLYDPDTLFDYQGEQYQVLHEFDFIYTEQLELFFVIAIFGIEYAINLGEPTLEGYENWLSENNQQSILYMKD